MSASQQIMSRCQRCTFGQRFVRIPICESILCVSFSLMWYILCVCFFPTADYNMCVLCAYAEHHTHKAINKGITFWTNFTQKLPFGVRHFFIAGAAKIRNILHANRFRLKNNKKSQKNGEKNVIQIFDSSICCVSFFALIHKVSPVVYRHIFVLFDDICLCFEFDEMRKFQSNNVLAFLHAFCRFEYLNFFLVLFICSDSLSQ